jgi:SAM-dependent methyltransferase
VPHQSPASLKPLDRWLRDARIAHARPFIPEGAALLDLGSGDGELIRRLSGHVGRAVGIEPTLRERVVGDGYELLPGRFPGELPDIDEFDVITMLAVIEHLAPPDQALLADTCLRLLRPNGRVVLTVPSPRVDTILNLLRGLHLIAGMAVHEHHGFSPSMTVELFPPPRYRLVRQARFQLTLNNLFVFEKV